MDKWKVEKQLEGLSLTEQQQFIECLIQQEKNIRNDANASIVTKLGLAALALGGIITTVCGMAIAKDPNLASTLQGVGISGTLATAVGTGALVGTTELFDTNLIDEVRESFEAQKNIKYLKNLSKELNQEFAR